MNRKKLPSAELLRSALRFERGTGRLFWRKRPRQHFANIRTQRWWNSRYAGREAFTAINNVGYFHGNFAGQVLLAHRVIWKMITGEEPPEIIDHRDRDSQNNHWRNLREATKGQNNVNSARDAGLHFDKARGKWAAYTKKNGVKIHFGRFETKAAARVARTNGAREIHGEFAP